MQIADRQKSTANETINLIKVCCYEPLSRCSRCELDFEVAVFETLLSYYLEVVWIVWHRGLILLLFNPKDELAFAVRLKGLRSVTHFFRTNLVIVRVFFFPSHFVPLLPASYLKNLVFLISI